MFQNRISKRWIGTLRTVGLPLGTGFVLSQVLSGVWGPASPASFGILVIGSAMLVPLMLPRYGRNDRNIKPSQARNVKPTRAAVMLHRGSIGLAITLTCVIVLAGLVRINREVSLWKLGRVARGQIINNEPTSPVPIAGGNVLYSFSYQGTAFTGWAHVNRERYQQLRLGTFVPVTYIPSDPSASHFGLISPVKTKWRIANTALLTLLSAVLAGYLSLGFERHFRRELSLAQKGTEVIGTITHCRAIHKRGQPYSYRVHYRVGLENNNVTEGSATVRPVCGEPTLVGFPVAVLLDSSNPEFHRPVSSLSTVQITSPTLLSKRTNAPLTPNLLE